jgi:hypothetical protein
LWEGGLARLNQLSSRTERQDVQALEPADDVAIACPHDEKIAFPVGALRVIHLNDSAVGES